MKEQIEDLIKEYEECNRGVARDTINDLLDNLVRHADVPLGSGYWYDLSLFVYNRKNLRYPFMHPEESELDL